MSLSHSPSIVTDGLVFAYDMGNGKKSWKGATTTNLYTDGDFSSQSLHPVRSGTWAIVADPRNNAKKVLKATPSGSNQYHGRDITVTVSSIYSLQMEVYVSPDFNGTNVQMYPEQGGSGANIAYNLSNKGTWQLLRFNGKSATTTNIRMLAYVLSAFTTGYVLISNVQVELNSFATPFVNGTRSNTQAVLDWTGNNTITANSLTYNADGSFSFNGTSDYISAPLSIGSDPLVTINQWIKRSGNLVTAGYWGLGGGSSNNGINGYTSVTNKIGWDLWGQTTFHTGQDYPLNTWVNVCWVKTATTFTTSTLKVYINGVEFPLTTTVRNNSSTVNITSGLAVGRLTSAVAAYHAPGDVGVTQVYDRALTATEVQQNYNALRGRYGI